GRRTTSGGEVSVVRRPDDSPRGQRGDVGPGGRGSNGSRCSQLSSLPRATSDGDERYRLIPVRAGSGLPDHNHTMKSTVGGTPPISRSRAHTWPRLCWV